MGVGYDVIIVGAGPAGAATAAWLAGCGWRVLVLDKATFPRDKICGEALSPMALPLLAQLGLRAAVEAAGHPLAGARIRAASGAWCEGRYPVVPGLPTQGLALPRLALDPMIVDAARRAGAEVREGVGVRELLWEGDCVVGVRTADDTVLARAVVLAEGRTGRLHPRMKRPVPRARRMAFVATFEGVDDLTDVLELHLRRPDQQVVLSPQGATRAALCAVVTGGDPAPLGAPPLDGLIAVLRADPAMARRLTHAEPVSALKGVELAPYHGDPVPVDGLVAVGDALCHFDPLTGEGMYRALRSASLAAEALDAALTAEDVSRARLSAYGRLITREFRWTYRFVDTVVALSRWPRGGELAVRGLAAQPALADRMIGYQGAMLPAQGFFPDVVRAGWAALFQTVSPIPPEREAIERSGRPAATEGAPR